MECIWIQFISLNFDVFTTIRHDEMKIISFNTKLDIGMLWFYTLAATIL